MNRNICNYTVFFPLFCSIFSAEESVIAKQKIKAVYRDRKGEEDGEKRYMREKQVMKKNWPSFGQAPGGQWL